LSDTFIAVAGLFTADDPQVYVRAAVEFAKDTLDEIHQSETDLRVLIAITVGGPLLCGLTGTTQHTFVASGVAIEEAISLTELSSPNKILVSPGAKELLPGIEFDSTGDSSLGYFLRYTHRVEPLTELLAQLPEVESDRPRWNGDFFRELPEIDDMV
jgi:class 3 adenylate cyclase